MTRDKKELINQFDVKLPTCTRTLTLKHADLQSHTERHIYKELMQYKNDTKRPEDLMFTLALNIILKKLQLEEKSDLTHLNDLFLQPGDVWSESPGLPWCEIGFKTKADIRDDSKAINDVRRFWHMVKLSYFDGNRNIKFPYCTVQSGPKKSSLKWTYPATINFGEAVFTTNLIKAYSQQTDTGLIAYTYKAGIEGCSSLYNRLHKENSYYVKLCFNETTVPAWLIDIAFLILLCNINYCNYAGYGVPDARRMLHMFLHLENYFISTHIKLANGTLIEKGSGFPKGSHFTELIGSVISAVVLQYLSCYTENGCVEDLVVMGNESLARVQTYWDLNECQNILQTKLGMNLDFTKCQVSKNLKQIHFIGHKRIWSS